jgi:predicted DsbA family dithiol-disulfide isomerase
MNDRITEGAVCGPDGCEVPNETAAGAANLPAGAATLPRIDIVSDAVCPWCFIGKRHLERALELLAGEGLAFSIHWHPFQLNPDMPPDGTDRREYRTAKFGSWERSQELDARIVQAAAATGLDFHPERQTRTPNTVQAHRLIWLAGQLEAQGHEGLGQAGLQDRAMEAVFTAYFVAARDIGRHDVLADCAAAVGIDRDAALAFLAGEDGREAVLRGDAMARNAGVNGVPSFFLDGQGLFSGAQPPEAMADALRRAHKILYPQAA